MRGRPLRGFSLLEFMVAGAIASVVTASAVASVNAILQISRRVENRAKLDSEAKHIAELAAASFQGLGGGSVRPWQGLRLEDDVLNGSDRLTFVDNVDAAVAPACAILSIDATHIRGDPSDCCFTAAHAGQQVMLSNSSADTWRGVRTTGFDSGSCSLEWTNSAIIPPPAGTLPAHSLFSSADGGVATPVHVSRLSLTFPEQAPPQLRLERENPSANAFLPPVAVAEGVYDLQFALAFDTSGDGVATELGQAGNDDEWFGNHPDDGFGVAGTPLEAARPSQLRMLAIGVMLGQPDPAAASQTARVLGGPGRTETRVLLRTSVGRAYLRNLNFFF